jgi:hypothetical protein
MWPRSPYAAAKLYAYLMVHSRYDSEPMMSQPRLLALVPPVNEGGNAFSPYSHSMV